MMKWLTALFFSIIVHILIFLSYVLFATESVEKTKSIGRPEEKPKQIIFKGFFSKKMLIFFIN